MSSLEGRNKYGGLSADVLHDTVTDTNRLAVDAVLEVSDIEIGAVEIKDGTTDTRAIVNNNNSLKTFNDIFIDVDTAITRNPDGTVLSVVETDGTQTKTSTVSRNPNGTISNINVVIS